MSRISRHVFAMESAEVAAKRATCYRLSVGCVITLHGRIVSTGYNGPAAGEPHCQGLSCAKTNNGGCRRAVHAELNALNFLRQQWGYARLRETAPHLSLYVTTCPCLSCARRIAQTKVGYIYYKADYRLMDETLSLLLESGTRIARLTASGSLVNPYTHDFVEDPTLSHV